MGLRPETNEELEAGKQKFNGSDYSHRPHGPLNKLKGQVFPDDPNATDIKIKLPDSPYGAVAKNLNAKNPTGPKI